MIERIRIVLAFGLLAMFAAIIWKPSVTGQATTNPTEELVVLLKSQAEVSPITGAVAFEKTNRSVEELKAASKKVQEDVLEDVNRPSFFERMFNVESEPDVKANRQFEVLAGMVVNATAKGASELEDHPLVEAVYPNIQFELALDDSVPLIRADDVVAAQVGSQAIDGSGTAVCVIDTGIESSHSMFSDGSSGSRVVDEKCFCSGGCCPNNQDEDDVAPDTHPLSHGTHVAGIVAGNGAKVGVAPGADIVAVKVCDLGCGLFDILSGIDYCLQVKEQYNVVAISGSIGDGGNYQTQSQCPTFFDSAIDAAYNAGITNVFASGNNGYSNGVSYPGCSPNAIAVGASDKNDGVASFSNRGPLMEVLAPGVSIVSAQEDDSTGSLSGTSQATPHVSGIIALMKQYDQLTQSPTALTPDQIKNTLVNTGIDISGYKRADARAALEALGLNLSESNGSNSSNSSNGSNQTNTPPTVTILNPASVTMLTNPISLEAQAADAEDGDLTGNITWSEDNESLGQGGNLTVNVSTGEHTLTASVIDSQGAQGSAQVTFQVPTCVADLDANGDDALNIGDVIVVLTNMFQNNLQCVTLTSEPLCELDYDQNADGVVNINDVIVLLTGILEQDITDRHGAGCFAT